MRSRGGWLPVAGCWVGIAIAVAFVGAQQIPVEQQVHIKYNSGQDVVPVYEGWERVPDGSFNMVFGYLNRNHVEELSIPVGPQNMYEPGPADRGQPAYFYPRENHSLFRVNVPKDWDTKKEVVWTLTAHGKTNQARATLLDIWEIDRKVEVANTGARRAGEQRAALQGSAADDRRRVGAECNRINASRADRDGHRRRRARYEEAATAAAIGADAQGGRTAVASERAAADTSASAAESVGDLDGMARTRPGDVRS